MELSRGGRERKETGQIQIKGPTNIQCPRGGGLLAGT